MFWKKNKVISDLDNNVDKMQEFFEKTPLEKMTDSANKIAKELQQYESLALQQEENIPSEELLSANKKMEAARKIVRDGRISYALIRQLVDHIKHWSSWVKNENFDKYIYFDATNITAIREDCSDGNGRKKSDTITFDFERCNYSCVIRDQGHSFVPGCHRKFGEVDFIVNNEKVLSLSMTEDYSRDYSRWEFDDVIEFHSGDWMLNLIKIAAQIEQRERKNREKFMNDKVIKAGRNITIDE